MKNLFIKTNSDQEKLALWKCLEALGFRIGIYTDLNHFLSVNSINHAIYPYTYINLNGKKISGYDRNPTTVHHGCQEFNSISELINHIIEHLPQPTPIRISLDENHNAVVNKDSVNMGYSTYSHAKIKEIYEAVLKMEEI